MGKLLALISTLLTASPPTEPAALEKARRLVKQGTRLQEQGHFLEAQAPLLEAIELFKKQKPVPEDDLLRAQNNLAAAYRRHGEPEKAIKILEDISKTFESRSTQSNGDPRLRFFLNNLATAYKFANRAKDARRTWEKCLSLAPAKPDEDAAMVLDNYASFLLDDTDEIDLADKYARQANAAWLAIAGKGSPDYAISLSTLGVVELRKRNLGEARILFTESLRLQARLLGPEHPDLGSVLNQLGAVEFLSGHPAEARKAYERSLAVSRKALPEEHPRIQDALMVLKRINDDFAAYEVRAARPTLPG